MAAAQTVLPEAKVQECICADKETEVTMPSGGRADCTDATHVIEIDRSSKWAEALGQSLYYGEQTGLKPRIVLFCDTMNETVCLGHRFRLEGTIAKYNLPIEVQPFAFADLAQCVR